MNLKTKIATFISILGHPLLTLPLFVAIVMFSNEKIETASFLSFLIIGCVFVPLTMLLYFRSKKGEYTNFDVSDRKQRKSVFVFLLPLLLIVCIILYVTKQSGSLYLSVLFATMLVFVSQIVNLFIKSSLHVSLNIYLSFLIMPMSFTIGIIFLLLTILIGWSRIVLGRHTLKEVLFGASIGLIIGLSLCYAQTNFKWF